MSVNRNKKESKYLLTGRRQISRILDIGLIVPELVGCDNLGRVSFLDSDCLCSVNKVKPTTSAPILIELKKEVTAIEDVFSADQILAIHFSSEEEKDDYLNRPFENVPNDLFTLLVSPNLFSAQEVECTEIYLPKVDRDALSKKYRKVDVFLGLVWECLVKKGTSHSLSFFGKKYTEFNPYSNNLGEVSTKLIDLSTGISTDRNLDTIMSEYFSNIEIYPLESGWATKKILQNLKECHDERQSSSGLFEAWHDVAIEIVNNERALPPLSDEKQILLRAMLLHLISPDKSSASRLSNNAASIGEKVTLVFEFLCAARVGFSAMVAEEKLAFPGAFFYLSKLAASWVNNTSQASLEPTKIVEGGLDVYSWNNQTINSYQSQSIESESLPIDNNLTYLVGGLESLSIVSKVETLEDGSALLILNKKEVTVIFDILIKRHSTFKILLVGDCVVLSTCILNFDFVSHKKKLTGPRMKSAFKYQGAQERDFRFVIDDATFNAEVAAHKKAFNPDKAGEMLKVLLDAHVWMQRKAT